MFKLKNLAVMCFGSFLVVGVMPIVSAQVEATRDAIMIAPTAAAGATSGEVSSAIVTDAANIGIVTDQSGEVLDVESISGTETSANQFGGTTKSVDAQDYPYVDATLSIENGGDNEVETLAPAVNSMKSLKISPSEKRSHHFVQFFAPKIKKSGRNNLVDSSTAVQRTAYILEKGAKICVPVITTRAQFSRDHKLLGVHVLNNFKFNSLGCSFSPSSAEKIKYYDARGNPVTPNETEGASFARLNLYLNVP